MRDDELAEEAKVKGLGYMNPATMTSTRDPVAQALELKRAVAVEELYTNEFLPAK